MNALNPYTPPSTETKSTSWWLIDLLVAGLWLSIPIGVLIGRQKLRLLFEEYGLSLPAATLYLFQPFAPLPFAIAAVAVIVALLSIPSGAMRRRFVWLACGFGCLMATACAIVLLLPLLSQALS